jgi:uncharacterized protein YegJ (DUF2314 family)
MKKTVNLITTVLAFLVVYFVVKSAIHRDKTVTVSSRDADMEKAIATARQTLPELFKAIKEGVDTYCVKVPITDSNGTEHFWLSKVRYADGKFTGTIDNDPDIVKCVKFGQEYTIKQSDISDWLYRRKGKVTGNFTLKVLFPKMKPAEVAEAKKAMGWD